MNTIVTLEHPMKPGFKVRFKINQLLPLKKFNEKIANFKQILSVK